MTREKVDEWLEAMAQTSICGLGQASPFPVRSVFRHWPELVGARSGKLLRRMSGRWFRSRSTARRSPRPRASCSCTRSHGTASSSRRSATTTSSTRTAAAGCASSASRARRGRCPACATRVAEGMVVSTNSSVPQFQRTLTEMLLSEHLNGEPRGPAERARSSWPGDLGVEAPIVLPDAEREPYEDRDLLMGYDPEACILCARCVRYTQEVMQCSALSLEGRGAEARVVPTWGRSWLDTECELCGGCLSVCPTGRAVREVRRGRAGRPRGRAREDEDDVHVLRRRLPDRPERRPARRSGSSRSPPTRRTSRTTATSASRAASPSTSSTTPTG